MRIEASGAALSGATGGRSRVDLGSLQGRDVESDMQNCGFVAAGAAVELLMSGGYIFFFSLQVLFHFFIYSDPIDC